MVQYSTEHGSNRNCGHLQNNPTGTLANTHQDAQIILSKTAQHANLTLKFCTPIRLFDMLTAICNL